MYVVQKQIENSFQGAQIVKVRSLCCTYVNIFSLWSHRRSCMELEKRGPAITAIQEKDEEFASDTDSEMESRSPHVTFQDSGMQSPDYAPRSPVLSERMLAMQIKRYDDVYSPISPTPMDEDDDDDDPQGDRIKAVLTKAAEQLNSPKEGDAIQAGTSAGSKAAPPIGAQNI
jgi:hypothetical protein